MWKRKDGFKEKRDAEAQASRIRTQGGRAKIEWEDGQLVVYEWVETEMKSGIENAGAPKCKCGHEYEAHNFEKPHPNQKCDKCSCGDYSSSVLSNAVKMPWEKDRAGLERGASKYGTVENANGPDCPCGYQFSGEYREERCPHCSRPNPRPKPIDDVKKNARLGTKCPTCHELIDDAPGAGCEDPDDHDLRGANK